MWVKICANTSLTDATHAVNSGADALGFVFAPSPRRVHAAEVRAITAQLPPHVERYGVFVNAGFDEIVATVSEAGLSGAQLHVNPDPELPARLRAHYATQVAPFHVISVLHFGPDFEQNLRLLEHDQAGDPILVDSRSEHAVGGTGLRFDWESARPALLGRAKRTRLILAGGLNPENVAEAVTLLEPWGVDVVSGVESAPGRKDAARVAAFIHNARRASALLEQWKTADIEQP